MAVRFRSLSPLSAGGAVQAFTSWSDNFPDVNISNFAGRGDYSYYGTTTRQLAVAANRFTFGVGTGGAPQMLLCPNQLAGCFSTDQFSQFKYAQDSGTDANVTRPTLAVLISGLDSTFNNFLSAYTLVIRANPAAGTAVLVRSTGWVSGTVGGATLATIANPAIGQTVRLQVSFSGTTPTLVVKYDGVTITTVSDPGGLTVGLPGFGTRGSDAPVTTFGVEEYAAGLQL